MENITKTNEIQQYHSYATHRLPEPDEIVYEWELNENSTRLEHAEAWSSEQDRLIRFSIVAAVNALVTISSLILILAILSSKKIRRNSFNLYLLYIALPDFFAGFSCFLTCVMSIPNATYYSEAMCGFQAFYLSFSITCNGWMNALIVYQVHKLLRFSHNRRRYFPPTRKEVTYQASAIYIYAIAIGLLSTFNIQGSPIKVINWSGFVCFPIDSEYRWGWFYFLVYIPLVVIIPCTYAFGAMFHIYWYGLLPKQGRTLTIALFLLRIICLYFFVWTPFLITHVIWYFYPVSPWVTFVTSVLSHLQAFFTTVVVYYTNDELKHQMNKVMTCQMCCTGLHGGDDSDDEKPSFFSFTSFSSRFSKTLRSFTKSSSRRRSDNNNIILMSEGRTETQTSHVSQHDMLITASAPNASRLYMSQHDISAAATAGGGCEDGEGGFDNTEGLCCAIVNNDESFHHERLKDQDPAENDGDEEEEVLEKTDSIRISQNSGIQHSMAGSRRHSYIDPSPQESPQQQEHGPNTRNRRHSTRDILRPHVTHPTDSPNRKRRYSVDFGEEGRTSSEMADLVSDLVSGHLGLRPEIAIEDDASEDLERQLDNYM